MRSWISATAILAVLTSGYVAATPLPAPGQDLIPRDMGSSQAVEVSSFMALEERDLHAALIARQPDNSPAGQAEAKDPAWQKKAQQSKGKKCGKQTMTAGEFCTKGTINAMPPPGVKVDNSQSGGFMGGLKGLFRGLRSV